MERTTASDVRAEIDITENGVAVQLVSEDSEAGEVTEDVEYLTFDELSDRAGENIKLHLSDVARESLSDSEADSSVDIPEPGDVVTDTDAPDWSEDRRVKVTGISDNVACRYFVDEHGYKTVKSENPDCDKHETVVEGTYMGGGDRTYAFPVSRLENRTLRFM